MASVYNNQIGQILNINTDVISNIQRAEAELEKLSKTSYMAAKGFKEDWGAGSDAERSAETFLSKLTALKDALAGLESKDVKLKLDVDDSGLTGLRDLQNLQMGNLTINMPGLEDAVQKISALVLTMNELGPAAERFAGALSGVSGSVTQNITNVNADTDAMNKLGDAMRRLSMQMTDTNKGLADLLAAKSNGDKAPVVKTVDEISAALDKNGRTASKLRTAYKDLNTVMMNTTIGSDEWNKASVKIKEVKTDLDRYMEAIRQVQNEMDSLRQRMMNLDMSTINSKSQNDLNGLASRLKSARDSIRPDGTTLAEWQNLDAKLLQVEQELMKVRDASEKNRDQAAIWKNISDRVAGYAGELSRLHRAYSEYMQLMGNNKISGTVWNASAIKARQLGAEIAEIERKQKLATQSVEDFNKALNGQDKTTGLKETIRDLMELRNHVAKGSAEWQHYTDKLRIAGQAYRNEILAEQAKIPAGQKAMVDAQMQYTATINQTILAHQRAKNAAEAQYQSELNKLVQLQSQLATIKSMHAQANSTMGKTVADKWYGGDITRVEGEIRAVKTTMDALTTSIIDSELKIDELRKKVGAAFSPEILDSFKDKLKTMSKTDLESTVGYLEKMRDAMSRGTDGSLSADAKALVDYIKAAKAELEDYKKMTAEVKPPRWSWEGDSYAMASRADDISKGIGAPAMLEELRALHKGLRAELEKTAGKGVAMSATLKDAYRKAGKAVKEVEKEIAGMPEPKGSARAFDEIWRSAGMAHSSVRELMADYNDLMQKMRDAKTPVDYTRGSDFEGSLVALTQLTNEMSRFRNATVAQNGELQHLMDRMASYQRDMNTAGNASMGRYRDGGIAELSKNLTAADKTAAKLQQDLSDVQNVLKNIPKIDIVTGKETAEWKMLVQLERQLKEELDKFKRDNKPAKPPMDPNSLAGLIDKAKELKKALSEMDRSADPAKWQSLNDQYKDTKKRIDEIKRAMGDVKDQQSQMLRGFRDLRTVMVGAFSAGTIVGYLKKMVNVHAEMRLQNTALAALLQNKDEADRMFMKIQQMALQSPFSIKDITTYTKQLAAYRVESEKLLDTTKMLADVSAGLGVGMDRLILAYGQVKSANYLRATEVRQFTEAGLNIAGELAQYFSELEGRMVSVGEVMEMITKRMVKFEDVEEVFKRVTAAGGLFYDMQKKQSETVYGMIQRISDAMTMMFDQIGQENSGAIALMLTSLRTMIQQWRAWLVYLKIAATAFIVYKGAVLAANRAEVANALTKSNIVKVWKLAAGWINKATVSIGAYAASLKGLTAAQVASKLATDATTISLKAFKTALIGTGIGAAVVALGMLIGKMHEWVASYQEAKAAGAKLVEMERESLKNANDMASRYKVLASVVSDLTKSESERQNALDEINRTYGDYLPLQARTITGIREMAGAYNDVTTAIKQHYAEVGKANKVKFLEGQFESQIQEALKNLDIEGEGVTNNEVYDWLYRSVTSAIEDGFDPSQVRELVKRFEKNAYDYLGKWGIALNSRQLEEALEKIAIAYQSVYKAKKDVAMDTTGMSLEQKNAAEAEVQAVGKQNEKYEAMRNQIQGINNEYTLLKKRITDAQRAGKQYDWTADAKKIQDMYNALNRDYKINVSVPTAQEIGEKISGSSYDIAQEMQKLGYDAGVAFVDQFDKGLGKMSTYMQGWVQKLRRMLVGPTEMEEAVEDVFEKVRKLSGLNKSLFDTVAPGADSTPATMIENLTKAYDALDASIKRYNAAVGNGTMSEEQARISNLNNMTVEEAQRLRQAYDDMRKAYGYVEKETTGGGHHGRDKWNDRVELIKKMNAEYKKLLKNYTQEEAHAKIMDSYKEQFAEIFAGTRWTSIADMLGFTDAKSANMVADILNEYSQVMSETSRKNGGEAYAKWSAELEVKIREESLKDAESKIDKFFKNYELSKTLTDLGVSADLATIVGGTPTDLKQLRERVEAEWKKMYARIDATDEKGLEAARQARQKDLDKIAEMEQKQREETLKNDIRYTIMGMNERGQIIAKAMQEQQKVMDSKTMSAEARAIALDQIQAKMREDIAKKDWEDFKGSEMYVNMLENLEIMSNKSIQTVIDKIKGMKDAWGDALSPGQIRGMVKELEKMQDEMAARNPWKAVAKSLKDIRKLQKDGKTLGVLQADMAGYQLDKEALEQEISDLDIAYGLQKMWTDEKSRQAQLSTLDAKTQERVNKLLGMGADEIAKIKKGKEGDLHTTQTNINQTQEWIDTYSTAQRNAKKLAEEWKNVMSAANNAYESIKGALEASGADMDSVDAIFADACMQLVDMAGQIIINTLLFQAMGVAVNASMGVIGYILIAVQAIATVLTALFKAHDKGLQNQIDNIKDKVDSLKKAYDRLTESMERAYELSRYQLDYRSAQKNLQSQINAYQQMVQLEERKKKKDKDAIKDYREQAEELRRQLAELGQQRIEDLGGIGRDNFRETASDFVDAWVDAFKETGDGLDALQDNFEEFLEGVFAKQATMRIAGKMLEPLMQMIDNAVSNDGKVMNDEIDRIRKKAEEIFPELNEALKELWLTFDFKTNSDLLLSDLQKGIQNITEAQAAALESITNSIRFGVYQQLGTLQEILATVRSQYGDGTNNPQLAELRSQTTLLRSIDGRLASVIRQRGSDGKPVVKVG